MTMTVSALVIFCVLVTMTRCGQEPTLTCDKDTFGKFLRDVSNCQVFYRCVDGRWHHFSCPTGTAFNQHHHVCDYTDMVNCDSETDVMHHTPAPTMATKPPQPETSRFTQPPPTTPRPTPPPTGPPTQPPTWTHRPPTWTPRPPTWTPRPPVWTPRPPTWTHRPPTWTPRPPTWTPRPPTWTSRPPTWTPRPPTWTPRPSTRFPTRPVITTPEVTTPAVSGDCPPYPCPSHVAVFRYPDWEESSCTSYYSCQRGRLRRELCPRGLAFNVATFRCEDPASPAYVQCGLFFQTLLS